MNVALPLDQMTTSDKLRALEEIWEDLCHSVKDLAPPAWHADVLRARKDRVSDGTSAYVDWGEAKKSIRDSVRRGSRSLMRRRTTSSTASGSTIASLWDWATASRDRA